MKPDFMSRTAKISTKMRAWTGMDYVDTEILEVILQDELKEYYDEDYYNGYGVGRSDGYSKGYLEGREDGYAACQPSLEKEAATYHKGYAAGSGTGYYYDAWLFWV